MAAKTTRVKKDQLDNLFGAKHGVQTFLMFVLALGALVLLVSFFF